MKGDILQHTTKYFIVNLVLSLMGSTLKFENSTSKYQNWNSELKNSESETQNSIFRQQPLPAKAHFG